MIRFTVLAALLALPLAAAAAEKPATCFNSDDGRYACLFEPTDSDGSFTVSAPQRPTYTLLVIERGVAQGFADFGTGNRSLPGPFLRSQDDRACWISEATDFALCAY